MHNLPVDVVVLTSVFVEVPVLLYHACTVITYYVCIVSYDTTDDSRGCTQLHIVHVNPDLTK